MMDRRSLIVPVLDFSTQSRLTGRYLQTTGLETIKPSALVFAQVADLRWYLAGDWLQVRVPADDSHHAREQP